MLAIFVVASMVVLPIDAIGPGHILDNEWTENEKFHFIWLWMLSWVSLTYSLLVLYKPASFSRREMQLAFVLPFMMWVAQLLSVAYYWVEIGRDPLPSPIRVGGVRIDWPGAVVCALWGVIGYRLFTRGEPVKKIRSTGPLVVSRAGFSVLLAGTAFLMTADTIELWFGPGREFASQHGLFHFTWANMTIAFISCYGLWIVNRTWKEFAYPIFATAWVVVCPWIAYCLVPIPSTILAPDGCANHLIVSSLFGRTFGYAASVVFVTCGVLLYVYEQYTVNSRSCGRSS